MRRQGNVNAQDLGNTPSAFRKTEQRNQTLFKALVTIAERRLDGLNAQELSKTARPFANPQRINEPWLNMLWRGLWNAA